MNVTKEFAEFLEDEGYGTLGTDLFVGGAPQDAPDVCYWVLSGGGSPTSTNLTNNKQKQYIINVFFRDTDQENVYEKLQAIEELINSDACTQLGSYEVLGIECTLFPTDNDLDVEDRTIGLLEATITIYA